MRTALCFQDGNFVGREYFARLVEAGRAPDLLVAVGRMRLESIAFEIERTGGLWNPPAIPPDALSARFESPADPAFAARLRAQGVDVAIQGGIGILKGEALAAPRIGWLNVHPGALPAYRGNACPEWAVLNDDDVVATAHLIDAGIDTGPVVCAARYPIDSSKSYAAFRAHLYAHCASVLATALVRLETEGRASAAPQDNLGASYRPRMDAATLNLVKARFASPSKQEREQTASRF
jgi:folate-dependent phosphoribosylglycinamide formyltransferase PurN